MSFLEIMENALLAEAVLSQIDALSLSCLQRTSKAAKHHVEAHYAHSFRILVAEYFEDVGGFLRLLRRVDGCVTGSWALKVIMNDADARWEARDLDLSIPAGTKDILCSYLDRFEGYCQCECEEWTQERLSYHQMLKRQRLKSVTKLKGRTGQKVDILESNTCNCIAPLCEFHSTAVVNALFPDCLTCFFPSHTLRYRSIPNALYQRERDHRSVAKYSGRGWQPIPHAKAILEEEVLLANTWNIDVSSALISREKEEKKVSVNFTRMLLSRLKMMEKVVGLASILDNGSVGSSVYELMVKWTVIKYAQRVYDGKVEVVDKIVEELSQNRQSPE